MPNIRSAKYNGFNSASAGTSPSGWMLWSGSKDIGNTSYPGVGLELVAGSESYLRFDSSQAGAELDIKARKFFIGTPSTQYISGSSGDIEISSSLFHLDPANSKLVIGAGTTINASLSADELFVPSSATSKANAKAYISSSGDAGFDGDGHGNYNADFTNGTASIAGWSISSSYLGSNNTILSSSGNIQMGTGSALEFYSGSFEQGFTTASLAAKWELDPDDDKSLQLRVPKEYFGGSEDRIAFYVSSSGEIGINTKTPSTAFDFIPSGSGKISLGATRISGSSAYLNVLGNITASGAVSASGTLFTSFIRSTGAISGAGALQGMTVDGGTF